MTECHNQADHRRFPKDLLLLYNINCTVLGMPLNCNGAVARCLETDWAQAMH